MLKLYSNIAFGFLFLFLFSCSRDEGSSPAASQQKIPISFSLSLPEMEEIPTRATDTDIKNLTVLVFDEAAKFIERIDIDETDLQMITDGVKFSILLDATSNQRRLHLIANARTIDGLSDRVDFSAAAPAATEAQVIPNLTTNPSNATDWIDRVMPLVMWGRVTLNGVSVADNASVKLLRTVACIKVVNSSDVDLSYFYLQHSTVLNAADKGNVAPGDYLSDAISTPSIGNPHASAGNINYSASWQTDRTMYIYERNYSGSNYLSVILAANYRGSGISFYHIALVKNGVPLNVVRNHRYTIRILSVNAPGFSDLQDALNSGPSNAMEVEILDANEEFPAIVADRQSWMGLNCNNSQVIYTSQSVALSSNASYFSVYSSKGVTPELHMGGVPMSSGDVWVTPGGSNRYVISGAQNAMPFSALPIEVICGNLSYIIPVEFYTIDTMPGMNQDGDSYVLDICNGLSNWTVWIPDTGGMLHLHPTANTASALTSNSGAGMSTELSNKYFGHAYLHINKSSNREDVVMVSSQTGGNINYKRIVIVQ